MTVVPHVLKAATTVIQCFQQQKSKDYWKRYKTLRANSRLYEMLNNSIVCFVQNTQMAALGRKHL